MEDNALRYTYLVLEYPRLAFFRNLFLQSIAYSSRNRFFVEEVNFFLRWMHIDIH